MRRLRFALALTALALAGSADSASAFGGCPSIIQGPAPYYTCAYTGHGACSNCEYECANGIQHWNYCNEQ
jgi:hypothetical protein